MEISDLVSASDLDNGKIGAPSSCPIKKTFFEQFTKSLISPEECSSVLQFVSGKDVYLKQMLSRLNLTNVKFIEQNSFTAFLTLLFCPKIDVDQLQL